MSDNMEFNTFADFLDFYVKNLIDSEKDSKKKPDDKQEKIKSLSEKIKNNNSEISKLKNTIHELESTNTKLAQEISELSKVDPLDEFITKVHKSEKELNINLDAILKQFTDLFNKLNNGNVQLNIDKSENKFSLMVEGSNFSEAQKSEIQKLKKYFKILNI